MIPPGLNAKANPPFPTLSLKQGGLSSPAILKKVFLCVTRRFFNGPIINFVSSPCGSGKTHAAATYIRDHRNENNFIYVAPSLALIAETKSLLVSLGVNPTVITSDTHARHVKKAIIDHLNGSFEFGDVVMVTWNAYVDLPFENKFKSRQAIIDEIPQLDRFYAWKLPRNLGFLTEYLESS